MQMGLTKVTSLCHPQMYMHFKYFFTISLGFVLLKINLLPSRYYVIVSSVLEMVLGAI